jgi:hypothetical protein
MNSDVNKKSRERCENLETLMYNLIAFRQIAGYIRKTSHMPLYEKLDLCHQKCYNTNLRCLIFASIFLFVSFRQQGVMVFRHTILPKLFAPNDSKVLQLF